MSWRCSHGHVYSDFEMEMGMTFAQADAMMEEQRLEYELDQDLKTERKLARKYVLGEADCPWPWYADAPIEVQKPEIIQT
jgi:hypothetical protein